MVGNEGDIFFVLLQDVAMVMGHLPMPVFYNCIKIYGYLYMVQARRQGEFEGAQANPPFVL